MQSKALKNCKTVVKVAVLHGSQRGTKEKIGAVVSSSDWVLFVLLGNDKDEKNEGDMMVDVVLIFPLCS